MGFGWLFIGYFLTVMNVPVFGIIGTLVRIVGISVIFMAILKLRKYDSSFNMTLVGAIILSVSSLALLTVGIHDLLFKYLIIDHRIISEGAKTVIGYVDQAMTAVFNALLLWGIFKIAKETEVKKISNASIRNFIFVCCYVFVYALSFLPTKGIQSAQYEFALITWVLYFVCIILNLILVFSCYANICDEDDVEMERKPSRMPLVNYIYEEQERRAQRAKADNEAYRKEKEKRREERKKRRNK